MTSLPSKYVYIPNFISQDDEALLLKKVYENPCSKWTQLSNRRLQNWGGTPHPKGMVAESLPDWLTPYFDKITCTGAFGSVKPNHCLVNEYQPGQGIMPHEDGSLFYPTVSTITLGSHTVLDFYRHMDDNGTNQISDRTEEVTALQSSRLIGSLLLERRSLVLIQEGLYKRCLHGIKEVMHDDITTFVANVAETLSDIGDRLERGTRVSLTIRNVPKTIDSNKLNLVFGKRRT